MRRIEAFFKVNDIEASENFLEWMQEIEYVDAENGEADSIKITVDAAEEKWLDTWRIDRGTEIEAHLGFYDWTGDGSEYILDCGTFLVDDIEIRGFPIEVEIGAVAVPVEGTEHSRKWEDAKISQIAKDICDEMGCGLDFYGEDLVLESQEQNRQEDIDFLFSLCSSYGKGMKVWRDKIVIYDREPQDQAAPTGDVLYIHNISSEFSVTDTTNGEYTGVEAHYKPKDSDDELTYCYEDQTKAIVLTNAGSSIEEARIKAKAALYDTNIEAVQLKFETNSPEIIFYAGLNYSIYGLGGYSGIWGVEKVTHTYGKSGYTQSVEAHAIALEKQR